MGLSVNLWLVWENSFSFERTESGHCSKSITGGAGAPDMPLKQHSLKFAGEYLPGDLGTRRKPGTLRLCRERAAHTSVF